MLVYLSYSRQDAVAARQLSEDLSRLGHELWMDESLAGGQGWWDHILAAIRSCDLFVLALSPASLSSRACMTEAAYAASLDRPILPVVVEPVDTALLPKMLADVQWVTYVNRAPENVLMLADAVSRSSGAPSLPSPLPEPPPAPISYQHDLDGELDQPVLGLDEQVKLVAHLRSALDTDHIHARTLLLRLRDRPDVSWAVAKEIDAALAEAPEPVSGESRAPARPPAPKQVFLSYRREDTKYIVGRLRDSLSTTLGRENVFFDVDSLTLGLDFQDEISRSIRATDVVLVLIGPRWSSDRLADVDDPVRLEIEAGMATGRPVVPVLLEDVVMPTAEQLPESLHPFKRRHGHTVRSDPHFDHDVEELMRRLGINPRPRAT